MGRTGAENTLRGREWLRESGRAAHCARGKDWCSCVRARVRRAGVDVQQSEGVAGVGVNALESEPIFWTSFFNACGHSSIVRGPRIDPAGGHE